jgi:hypothetical protein
MGKSSFVNSFLVGCDPEVAVLGQNGLPIRVDTLIRKDGEVGYDHGGRVLEFRPKPFKGTYTLVKELKKLVEEARVTKLGGYKWKAGAVVKGSDQQDTLGGHVWIDLNPHVAMHVKRVQAMDKVTELLERLEILPRQDCITRRRGAYGKFGDVRILNGNRPRFEYRTMPSWMFNPKVAFACLTLAKLAAASPEAAMELLKPANASANQLHEFLATFKSKDRNAARLLEKVLSKDIRNLQADPDGDVREAWAGKLSF